MDFINKEILFIKTRLGDLQRPSRAFFGSTAFYGLLSLIGIGLLALYLAHLLRRKRRHNHSALRSQKASKVARKRLSKAKKHLDRQETEAFYQALSTALWGYFADKLALPQSRLSKDVIAQRLREHEVEESQIEEMLKTMERAEMARYSSGGGQSAEDDYQKTALLLTKIDQHL